MRNLTTAGIIIVLCTLFCSCGDGSSSATFLGMWGQVGVEAESSTRFYERTQNLAGYLAGYSIEPGGYLVVVTSAYVGGDFPSRVDYSGTWESESEDVLVFHYENYRGQITVRFEIVQLGNGQLTAVVLKTGPV